MKTPMLVLVVGFMVGAGLLTAGTRLNPPPKQDPCPPPILDGSIPVSGP